MWAQADPLRITLSGSEILTFNNVGSAVTTFTAVSATRRAGLENNTIAGFPSANFNGATSPDNGSTDVYQLTGGSLIAESPYAYAVVFKLDETLGGTSIISRFTSSTVRSYIGTKVEEDTIIFSHGTSALEGALIPNAWNYCAFGFDGTNLNGSVNGVTITPVVAAGITGSSPLCLGGLNLSGSQAMDGNISDALAFNSANIFTDGGVQAFNNYCQTVYGL
jgi:hypothetical protein